MLLQLLPPNWSPSPPAVAGGGGGGVDPIAITEPSIDEIRRELGLDFEERLDELIHQEIMAPFGMFAGASLLGAPITSTAPSNDPFDSNIFEHLFADPSNDAIFDDWYDSFGDDLDNLDEGEESEKTRKPRSPNLFQYEFGDVHSANWHVKFLAGAARERTR